MATQRHNFVLPQLFTDPGDRIVQAAVEAARQSAFASSIDTFNLLAALPDAYLRSQKRELKRLSRVAGDEDVRVATMHESIRHARQLSAIAKLGRRRVDRMQAALSGADLLVHGFISTAELEPAPRLLVRLTIREHGKERILTEPTEDDGYFRFLLGHSIRRFGRAASVANVAPGGFAQTVAHVNDRTGTAAPAEETVAAAAGAQRPSARLEILDASGRMLHSDTLPMFVDTDSTYREYVLADGHGIGGDTPRDLRDGINAKDNADANAPAPTNARATRSDNKPRGKT